MIGPGPYSVASKKRGWGQLKANERNTIFGTDVSFRGSVPTLRTMCLETAKTATRDTVQYPIKIRDNQIVKERMYECTIKIPQNWMQVS